MSDGFEYRVVWKPEGRKRLSELRQTLKGAEAKVGHLQWARTKEARDKWADEWDRSPLDGIPALESVEIQRRKVGDWEACP